MASPTQWTWVWANSGRQWRTGKPGVLQLMGLQRVRHDLEIEQQWHVYGNSSVVRISSEIGLSRRGNPLALHLGVTVIDLLGIARSRNLKGIIRPFLSLFSLLVSVLALFSEKLFRYCQESLGPPGTFLILSFWS